MSLRSLVSRRSRAAAALTGLALAASLANAPGAATAADRPRDGSEPLPGYTVSNPPLEPLVVEGEPTRVRQGVREHAAYTIEVPQDWNGELVLWAHGYRGTGTVLTVDPPGFGLRQRLLEQGYAWAASSYARNGYDVRTGVLTTRDLAGYAARLLRRSEGERPERTYVAGVSMGGHVIGRSLEQYPRFYDGALPMCGVLGDHELFDYFLSYNLLAQDLADVDAYPVPADYQSEVVPQIKSELGLGGPIGAPIANSRGAQLRDLTTELSGGQRPGADVAFTVWKDFLFTLATPDDGGPLALNGGRLAQNLDTTYAPSSPVDVDATVERVAPSDPRLRRTRSLTAVPRIEGRPKVPVLTLHDLGDLFVPFSMEQVYAREAARRGQDDLLVQRAVRAAGHCEFTEAEVARAWDDLTTWVESHRLQARPAGDDVLTPAVLAEPTYGCEFTDPAGYAQPQRYPTRALYPRCPER